MRPGTRVLVVEDDRYIRELMAMELEHRGLEVLCVPDGPSGLEAAGRFRPDIVVLDVMLPGLDGVGVLKRLRTSGSRVPVVMLTARDAPTDKIHSLDLGADDYLTKPFHVEELLARMRAMLRRTEAEEVLRVAPVRGATRASRTVARTG
jgi:two-component system, OmpR family, response regulator